MWRLSRDWVIPHRSCCLVIDEANLVINHGKDNDTEKLIGMILRTTKEQDHAVRSTVFTNLSRDTIWNLKKR